MTGLKAETDLRQALPTVEPPPELGGRAIAHTIFNRLCIVLINACTGIITARMLLPNGRGELAAMILSPVLLGIVTTAGIPSSLIYFLSRRNEHATECMFTGLWMTFTFSSLFALLAACILPLWLGRQYSPEVITLGRWLLAATPVMALTTTGRAILEAKGQFSKSNQLVILSPFVTLIGLLLVIAVHRMTPFSAGACYMLGTIPSMLLMFVWIIPSIRPAARFRRFAARQLLSYGLRSFWIDLLGTMGLQVDQVLVISLLHPSAMGVYGVMLSLSRMFNLFQISVVVVLFPKATGQSPETVVDLAESCARISTMITGFCCLVVAVFGLAVLRFLYGSQYADNGTCFRILLLEVTISGAVFILAQAFMALGHPGVVAVLQGIGLSVSIPLMLWLVPRLGVEGAALSLLISTIARFALVFMGYRFILKVRSPRMWPRSRDFYILTDLVLKSFPQLHIPFPRNSSKRAF